MGITPTVCRMDQDEIIHYPGINPSVQFYSIPNTGQIRHIIALLLTLVACLGLVSCSVTTSASTRIQVRLTVDHQTTTVLVAPNSTVQQVLDASQVTLNSLDRVTPPQHIILQDGDAIQVVRVTESFEVKKEIIPFERQTVRNESLPVDTQLLLQSGKNGSREITFRRVFEDGVEVTSEPLPVKSVVIEEPLPEIVMIGIQSPIAPLAIPGKLAYIRNGNAWIVSGSTTNRLPVAATGDLDGRILSLSEDGEWLLFTRRSDLEGEINRLWVAHLTTDPIQLLDLKVSNIIHFADWVPDWNSKIVFSTVEKRLAAPGWQANNDLFALNFSGTGWTSKRDDVLEANTGGIYGWWGMNFQWAPNGRFLGYARPDSVGLFDYKEGTLTPTLKILPYQTVGDWAWVPGLSWGPDGKVLFTVEHIAPEGSAVPESSPQFDLTAIPLESGPAMRLVSQAGMFAYPLASPFQPQASMKSDYQVAYLQAIFPDQSQTSRYRVTVMDRDGSNRQVIFPPDGNPGLEPQRDWGAWSPAPLPDSQHYALSIIYQGNIWIVDAQTGQGQRITNDGLTTRVIWR